MTEPILNETITDIWMIFGSSALAFITAMLLTPPFYRALVKFRIGKQIRDKAISGEKSSLFSALHLKKKGTPTMGGLLIWGTILIVVLFSRGLSALGIFERSLLNRKETWLPLFTLASFGILGAIDDYLNIRGIGNKGLSARLKFIWLLILGSAGAWWFYSKLGISSVDIPLPTVGSLDIGIFYIPLFIFVIIATANSVNFTDGLDGLASGLLITAFGAFGVIAFAKGLLILAALCGVICGALFAFLWFNIPPAKFIMGDTGSLALGATLAVIAMLTDQTLILPIVGFIFVIETLSVIIQLSSKKLFKKKVFLIAPVHHHYEQKGWQEATIVMRFWIIGGIFATFGTILALLNIL